MAVDPAASDPRRNAALALHRFGCGPKPGDIARIASDPRGALLAELKTGSKTLADAALASGAEDARATVAFQQEKKREREARRIQASGGADMAASGTMAGAETNEMSLRKPDPPLPQQIPALIQHHLEIGQLRPLGLGIEFPAGGLGPQLMLLLHQVLDMGKDVLFGHEAMVRRGCGM